MFCAGLPAPFSLRRRAGIAQVAGMPGGLDHEGSSGLCRHPRAAVYDRASDSG